MRGTGNTLSPAGSWALAVSFLALPILSPALHAAPPDPARQGLTAIDARDYQQADACFADAADKAGPVAYDIIGEAEAAIPGRELRAISWLSAYLAANPNSPNAAKTKAVIDALDARRRQKTLDLILRFANAEAEKNREDNIKAAATGGPIREWTNGPTHAEEARDKVLQSLAYRWEQIPDFDAARLVINMMLWDGTKTDAITTLVTAESDEAAKRFAAGDVDGSAKLLAAAQKDMASSPRVDAFAGYRVAVTELQDARVLIGSGKLDEARPFIAAASGITVGQDWEAETMGAVATMDIVLARAQIKSGDVAGAKATLAGVTKLATTINHPGSPLKYTLLRDLADAQTDAGDLAGARQSLSTAAPLASIYNDADRSRLEVVDAQIKIGDFDGAKATVGLMKDAVYIAKAQREMATPPKPAKPGDPMPLLPPFTSRDLAMAPALPPRPIVTATQWIALLELDLDAPCFTAFHDDSDCDAIASEIEKEPVRLARGVSPHPVDSLEIVTRRMVDAQVDVDKLLKAQFGP